MGRVPQSRLLSRRPKPGAAADGRLLQAHFDAVANRWAAPTLLRSTKPTFVDSITVAGRLCFKWCEQQPESFNDRGKKDVRGTYGLMGREMIGWLTHLQHTRGKNVIFVGILENLKDEFNVTSWQLQIEGSKTGKELPGIVDQIATMQFIDFGDGKPTARWSAPSRTHGTTRPRIAAGRLEQIEEPHLGKWLAKLTGKGTKEEKAEGKVAA
jgi:hypothetical protein